MTTKKSAIFSKCNRYRYELQRCWSKPVSKKSTITFIGLNPSTADATVDDPTIRKCIAYAQKWGYSRMLMVNLFAWKATDPASLLDAADPIGSLNDHYIKRAVNRSSMVIACWGEQGVLLNRASELRGRYPRRLRCLKVNRSGEPTHPLYLPAALAPVRLF